MLVSRLHVPWPEDHQLPQGAHFLDDSRRVIGFDSLKEQKALGSLTNFGGDGPKVDHAVTHRWLPTVPPQVQGVVGPYNPDISVREFRRYVPYELGYGVHREPELRTSMRRFVVDDGLSAVAANRRDSNPLRQISPTATRHNASTMWGPLRLSTTDQSTSMYLRATTHALPWWVPPAGLCC